MIPEGQRPAAQTRKSSKRTRKLPGSSKCQPKVLRDKNQKRNIFEAFDPGCLLNAAKPLDQYFYCSLSLPTLTYRNDHVVVVVDAVAAAQGVVAGRAGRAVGAVEAVGAVGVVGVVRVVGVSGVGVGACRSRSRRNGSSSRNRSRSIARNSKAMWLGQEDKHEGTVERLEDRADLVVAQRLQNPLFKEYTLHNRIPNMI